jgi:hypothetical protein
MRMRKTVCAAALALFALGLARSVAHAQSDHLSSWNEGPVKTAITDFVARVTTLGSADFVPAEERIAVFDNDGTLWSEQPLYFQVLFALDRIRAMAP